MGLLTASRLLAVAFFARLLRARRLLLPLGVVGIVLGVVALAVSQTRAEAMPSLTTGMVGGLVFGFVTPFVSLYYGMAIVGDEVEGKTIAWLLMRPVPRRAFILGRTGAAYCVALLVQTPLLLLPLLLASDQHPEAVAQALWRIPPVVALGTAVYTSIYLLISVIFRRAFLVGLLHLGLFEFVVGFVPGRVGLLTVRAHLYNLMGFPRGNDPIQMALGTPPAQASSLLLLVGILAVALAVAAIVFERREFVEDTSEAT